MGRISGWGILLGAMAVFFMATAFAETRTALVIGNGSYLKTPLNNPVNDAKDMASVLKDCGFDVILRTNKDRAGMMEAVRLFGQRLKKGGVGLFFYAGHGIQVDGINYMVPVNADASGVKDIQSRFLEISSVLSAMEKAKNDLNIVILDACRNNPFQVVKGVSKGLALMDAPKGSYIAFSTRPGSLSGDGAARNGLYTAKLLKHIRTPGLSLVDLFMNVRNDVLAASNDNQEPWDNHSLRRHFYFMPDGTEPALPYGAGVVSSDASVGSLETDTLQSSVVVDTDYSEYFDSSEYGIEGEADYSEWDDEPDAPAGYRKEVVVEYQDNEPVEVVYYLPDDPEDEVVAYSFDEDNPLVLTYPDTPSVFYPPPVSRQAYETRPDPAPRVRSEKPPKRNKFSNDGHHRPGPPRGSKSRVRWVR